MVERISFEEQYNEFIHFVLNEDLESAEQYLINHTKLREELVKKSKKGEIDYGEIEDGYLDNIKHHCGDLELKISRKNGKKISISGDFLKLSEILGANTILSPHASSDPKVLEFKLIDYPGSVKDIDEKLQGTDYERYKEDKTD